MLKRCLSGILALVLTLGLFVTIPQEANAATVLTSSAALVDVLKSMEGYSSKPFWDYAQWTVGYGTKCPDDKLDEYKKNGITKAEAQALLEKELTKAETAINKFTATYGLTLKQNEFDALVSFTYNCGTGWTKESDGYFNTAVRNGDKSNALLYGMLLWSTAGGEYILINRRMCEANIYINGEYRAPNAGGTLYPDNFRWVFLDGNGGDTYYKIYAFDSDNPQPINAALRSTPTGTDKDGNTFSYTLAGWYTAEGQEVTVLDDTITRGQHLYAKWKDPEGNILNPVATQPANPVQVVVTGDNVNIRSGPGTNYSILGTAKKNTVLTITDTYKSSNYTWGQFSDGWISLSYTNYDKTPIILRQPDSVTAAEGGIVQVTLDVAGANLSYQWYVASANSDKFYKSSITDSVYTTKMSSSRNGRQVYCVITGNNGISVQSETVTLHMEEMLAITKQPTDVAVSIGSTAKVQVTATGKGLSYQWYYRDLNADTFQKSSVKKATYSVKMSSARHGRSLYCEVTDQNGSKVRSEIVTISSTTALITKEPESAAAANGEKVSVKVEAAGTGLTYQWYVCSPNGTKFSKSSIKTDIYCTRMDESRDGRQVYCVITDADGNTVKSKTVSITIDSNLYIIQHPASVMATNGQIVNLSVKASGKGLTYQWYFCNAGKTKFSLSSIKTDTYCTKVDESRDGRQVYCVITDANGKTVKTNTVTIHMDKSLSITEQPQSATAPDGQIITTSVKANGKGLTYQWYFCNAGKTKFSLSSIKTDTYCTRMDESRDGRQVYCVITDADGNTVKSKTVTIHMDKSLSITEQPKSATAPDGQIITTSVKASGKGLTYQWYFCNAGKTKFSMSSLKTDTYCTRMDESRDGRQIYCVITDTYGNTVTSETVTISMLPENKEATALMETTASTQSI